MNDKEIYMPYFRAIKSILEGKPIKELDDIRKECNQKYFKLHPKPSNKCFEDVSISYTPESILASFFADAENQILLGKDPSKVYSSFSDSDLGNAEFNNSELGKNSTTEFRKRGRKILEYVVEKYLK